ncbi:hypothetical protein Ancab_023033 [Ancistrocladus abbreviatus]
MGFLHLFGASSGCLGFWSNCINFTDNYFGLHVTTSCYDMKIYNFDDQRIEPLKFSILLQVLGCYCVLPLGVLLLDGNNSLVIVSLFLTLRSCACLRLKNC